eukprot:Pgem_evm1s12128
MILINLNKRPVQRELTLSNTLDDNYAYPHDFPSFNAYVASRHSSELVEMLQEIKLYKSKPCLKSAIEIYKTFIRKGSSKEVNIGHDIRDAYDIIFNNCINNLELGDENLFDCVNEYITELVKSDLFVPFLSKQEIVDKCKLCFSMFLYNHCCNGISSKSKRSCT